MLIKEFRILMPMSVEEYQTGQLYTIQKKSRIESTGTGSGVEIIENKPFVQNNETGQYTLKVYHADERLPSMNLSFYFFFNLFILTVLNVFV
mgnify:CR=1 FL=1